MIKIQLAEKQEQLQECNSTALPSFSIINKGLDNTKDDKGPSRSAGLQLVEIPLATDWPPRRVGLCRQGH
jgi:hypothetical protein